MGTPSYHKIRLRSTNKIDTSTPKVKVIVSNQSINSDDKENQ